MKVQKIVSHVYSLFILLGNIEYGSSGHELCQKINPEYKPDQLYPEESCYDAVEFKKNGDLVLTEQGLTLHFKEFCVTPTSSKVSKGSFMIQGCFPQKAVQDKFSFYFIIMSVSIFCLSLTILVYVFFHKARF